VNVGCRLRPDAVNDRMRSHNHVTFSGWYQHTEYMIVTSHAIIHRIGTQTATDIHTFVLRTAERKRPSPIQARPAESAIPSGESRQRRSSGMAEGWLPRFDVRLPTGDAYNFLGSGATGVRGFLVASGQMGKFRPTRMSATNGTVIVFLRAMCRRPEGEASCCGWSMEWVATSALRRR